MDAHPTFEELKLIRHVSRSVDELLEESLRARESLQQTFHRLFPALLDLLGATGVVINTLDEELAQVTFHHGTFGGLFAGTHLETGRWGVHKLESGDTFCSQALLIAGHQMGSMGLYFQGDRTAEGAKLRLLLDAVAEELDTVLASVQTASDKHQVLVAINQSLSDRVFESGMDGAVRALCERVRVPGCLVVYRDAVESGAVHYRSYQYGQLEFSPTFRKEAKLEAAIRTHGQDLILPSDHHLQAVVRSQLGQQKVVETVLISGVAQSHALGKILVWSGGDGFSAYSMDLLRLLASALSQRLVDYNRERIHLAQFFSASTIDELLRDSDYERTFLVPRAEEVGILFADINGFTSICERVLQRPECIGKFVDDWSEEAVSILHRHGGVFDKMVGDCVIGLWGPPFFRDTPEARAAGALKAAIEIQRFTKDVMSQHPELAHLSRVLHMPGLGVAVGLNLTQSFCGLFGPNRNYTSFSTGMNQTARLQSLGGFRETLVMDSAVKALASTKDPELAQLKFGPLIETSVKNVAHPLRYHKLLD